MLSGICLKSRRVVLTSIVTGEMTSHNV